MMLTSITIVKWNISFAEVSKKLVSKKFRYFSNHFEYHTKKIYIKF